MFWNETHKSFERFLVKERKNSPEKVESVNRTVESVTGNKINRWFGFEN